MATLPKHDTQTNRTVVLDFNGGLQVYRNPELGLIIPAQIEPGEFSAKRRAGLVSTLNREYASQGVRFTTDTAPGASAVHIGRTDAFDTFGRFLGLAEGIGSGDAFVLLDASANDAELADVICHEAGHILGMLDHGGAGLARYAWKSETYDYFGAWNAYEEPSDWRRYLRRKTTTTVTYHYVSVPSDLQDVTLQYHTNGTEIVNTYSAYGKEYNADTQTYVFPSTPQTTYISETRTIEAYRDGSGLHVAKLAVYGCNASGCSVTETLHVGESFDYDTIHYHDDYWNLSGGDKWTQSNYNYYRGSVTGCEVGGTLSVGGYGTASQCLAKSISVSGSRSPSTQIYGTNIDTTTYELHNGVAENCILTGGVLTVTPGGIARDIVIRNGTTDIGVSRYYLSGNYTQDVIDREIQDYGYAKATNLIVEHGSVSVHIGGDLHNATIDGGLSATAGAVLGGVITCKAVDLSGVTPQTNITIKLDLNDYANPNFTEKVGDDIYTYYYANYTRKTVDLSTGKVISTGTFDNKDGRFDMKNWDYTFGVNIGRVDQLSVGSVVVDFGGTEKDFDSGSIEFLFPSSDGEIPFQMRSDKRNFQIGYTYYTDGSMEPSYLTYNGDLFGEAADVLWLEFGEDEDVEYTIDLASMMSGATEELTIINTDTGKETLQDARIQGATLVVKGGAETADLVVTAEDSNKRDYECDLELIVVPEEIPVIGKLGTKKFSEMLKRAQQGHLTTVADYLPNNIHTKLFGMAFDLTNMGISLTVDWAQPSMSVKLQGKMEWAIGKGTAGTGKQLKLVVDLSGDNYISISGNRKAYSWDIVGELKVPDFKIGKFAFSNMVLKVNKGQASFSASAYVQLPWIKYSFGGSIGIVDGYLDSMAIGVDSLNIPLGGTGLFLQKIEGGIKGIATELNLTFEGTLGLTAGPKFKVEFVDWLGLDNGVYSLCEMTLTGSISTSGDLEGSSSFVILGGLATGSGSASLKGGELTVKGTYTFLNSCISVKGELHASTGGITIEGTGTATVPREKYFGPLAGYSMSANVAAEVRTSASDSFVMAWQIISVLGNEFTIGFKSNFEGKVSMLGSTDLLKKEEMDSSLRSLRSISVPSASVAAPLRGEATPSASEKYLVSDSGLTFFQVYLSVSGASMSLAYGDTEYTQADIAAGNCENMQIVSELSGETWITVAVDNAALGEWTINAYGDANATFSAYTLLSGIQVPVLNAVELGEGARSATLRYTADLSDLTNATISVFRADAGSTEYNGVKIAEIAAADANGIYEYVMPDEVEGGEYSFYLAVNSEGHTPVYSAISDAYTFRVLDLEAPDQIQTVNSEWKSSGTVLTWDEPWDDRGVAGYKIGYRILEKKIVVEEIDGEDGETGEDIEEEVVWTETDVKTTSFVFDSASNGTYVFRVEAYDEAGNPAAWSKEQSCLVLTVANAKYKDVTLTESIELGEYESAAGITAGVFAVTAASNSLVSGSALGDAEIGGIMENSTVNGEVSLLKGGTAYDTAVNGSFTINGTGVGITVAAGGQLTIGNGGKARDITVEAGGLISLMPGSEFENLTLAYGAGLIVAGGKNGNYRLTDDIRTAGTLSSYRYISANGHKIHFEQYKQASEYKYTGTDYTRDEIAFLSDMDKLIGNNVLDVVIDSSVYGSFKIADSAEYFNGTITVTDSVDGSSAVLGFDKLMLVGNALCQLTKNDDGALWLHTYRSEIGAPTVSVANADSNLYDTFYLNATKAENSGYVTQYTYRYSMNEDMSDAVVVSSGNDYLSVSKYDLVDNATYYAQVSVENDNGVKSLWSDAVSFTVVPKLLPDAPTTLTVTDATNKNSSSISLRATGVDDSNYTVREYRFRYADNPEMKNAVVITTGQRLINYAYILKSDIEDGKDYYVQAGVKQLNDWSYWSDTVVFNTQGWDYDGITIGPEPDGDYNSLNLDGRAKNVTVIDGGFFYGSGDVDGLTIEAGGFFRHDDATVTNAVVKGGQYWAFGGIVSDIMVESGELYISNGAINGAVIGSNAVFEVASNGAPTITGTILIQGDMDIYVYSNGFTTDANFVFDLGAHEADKDKAFISYVHPILGTRTFTAQLDDTPEIGDYRITSLYQVPENGLLVSLKANDGTKIDDLQVGGEAILHNGLYYSLVDQKGTAYLHVSDSDAPAFIGKVKLSKNGVIYDSQNGYTDLAVSASDECDYALVEAGGQLSSVTVGEGGKVDLGGTVFGATIENGGQLTIKEGGLALSNIITVNAGGNVTIEGGKVELGAAFHLAGGTITVNGALQGWEDDSGNEWGATRHWFVFELDKFTAVPSGVMISDYAMLQCNPEFTATVSTNQAKGEYKLAGNAASFTGYVSISYEGDNDWPEYLYVGNECTINGTKYALAVKNDILTLTVGKGAEPGPGPGPDDPGVPDGGENDNPLSKDGKLDPDAVIVPNPLTSDGDTNIHMDAPGSVSEGEYSNYVGGTEDKADYAKITLTKAAKLSFTVKADSKVKLTFYQLVEKKNKPGTYTKKSLKTVSVSGGTKSTASVLIEGGDNKLYYVAVENKNKKNAGAYYNVSLNTKEGKDQSKFFSDGDNGDNNFLWNKTDKWNEKVYGEDIDALVIDSGFLGDDDEEKRAVQIDTDTETVVEHDGFTNFVGFGDPMDVRKIELKSAAKLSFDVNKTATGAVKLVVYTETNGKMVVANSKLTMTVKAAASSGMLKNQVVLRKGVYYIAVQSTDAKKGKEAYYNVSLNANSVFYVDGDVGKNNFNSKTKATSAEVGANPVDLTKGELVIDGLLASEADVNVTVGGVEYHNFVGTGDTSDVVRINANDGMKLSLKVTATDAVSLVVYGLQKNGTLKALKTVKSKNNVAELNDFELKAKSAPGGQFFLGVTSTNAKKGSAAYYNVDVVDVSGQNPPLSSSEASSLAMPETDSLVMSDSLSLGQYDTDVLAGTYLGSAADKLFGESGNGLLASL